MKKILIAIIFISIFTSCDLLINPHPPIREHENQVVIEPLIIQSKDLFTINGNAYTYIGVKKNVLVYNPNTYQITILIGDEKLIIQSHDTAEVSFDNLQGGYTRFEINLGD